MSSDDFEKLATSSGVAFSFRISDLSTVLDRPKNNTNKNKKFLIT